MISAKMLKEVVAGEIVQRREEGADVARVAERFETPALPAWKGSDDELYPHNDKR